MNIDNLTNLPKDNFFIHIQNNRQNSYLIKDIIKKYYPNVNTREVSFTGDGGYKQGYCVFRNKVEYETQKYAEEKELIIYKSPQDFIKKHSEPQIVTDYSIF